MSQLEYVYIFPGHGALYTVHLYFFQHQDRFQKLSSLAGIMNFGSGGACQVSAEEPVRSSVRNRQEGETNIYSRRRQITYGYLAPSKLGDCLSCLSLTLDLTGSSAELLKPVLMHQKVQVYSVQCTVAGENVHIF